MSALQIVKLWLVEHLALGKDALHIYVALILFFGTALLARRPLSSWLPWLVVFVAALSGEIWDIADRSRADIAQSYSGNLKDVWNTLLWPTAILLLARHSRLDLRAPRV